MTADKAREIARKTPNSVLRNIREQERRETRAEFAGAMALVARESGEQVFPDAKYVERLESGAIVWPRPPYRNILVKLCGRPIGELGFTAPVFTAPGSADARGGALAGINMPLRNAILASGMEVSQLARKVGVDPKSVQRWITLGRTPHPRHRWKTCQALGCEESELWPSLFAEQTTLPAEHENKALQSVGAHSEDIRDIMSWVARTNTTDDAIEQIASAVGYLAEAHSEIPPQMVLREVWQTHQTVEDFLLSGKQRLRQTHELLRIDSELLAYACLILGNLGRHLRATECGMAALIMAQEAGCDEAKAWSAKAKTARWQQKYIESAEAARRGFEVSALSPTKVELAYREANAIALFGDAARARQALRRAQQTADLLPASQGNPRSVWSFPTGRQAIFELSVAIHTGDPDGALRATALAEEGWTNGEPKIPATWAQIQAGSSIAYLMKDSLDEVAYHVTPVLELPRELRISTVIGYLQQLEILLAQPRFAKSTNAIELTLQIRDFISSSPLDMGEIG